MSMPELNPENWKNGEPIAGAEFHELRLDVTTDAEGEPTPRPTAKVIAGASWSIGLVVIVALLTAITPDLFDFLGRWAPVAFAGVVALAGSLAAYIKKPSAKAF